ncbi:MAG: FkbM family methyltransferase [Acidimicrobiales bacterium]
MPLRGRQRVVRQLFPPERLHGFSSVIRLSDGRLYDVVGDSFLEWSLLFFGPYEPEITRLLGYLVKPGNTVLDIGANVGIHTVTMAKLAGAGRVLAFEPHPQTVERLRANLALNGIDRTEVVQVALLDRAGAVSLFDSNDSNRAMASLHAYDGWSSTSVEGMTLDDVLQVRAVPKVDVVKIDVEGFEPAVLEGARGMLARDRPALIFEYMNWAWENCGYALADTLQMLRDVGYRDFFTIETDRLQPLVTHLSHPANLLAVPESTDLPLDRLQAAGSLRHQGNR